MESDNDELGAATMRLTPDELRVAIAAGERAAALIVGGSQDFPRIDALLRVVTEAGPASWELFALRVVRCHYERQIATMDVRRARHSPPPPTRLS